MIDRRALLATATSALVLPVVAAGQGTQLRRRTRKIATEEAFAIPEWCTGMDALPLTGPEAHERQFLRVNERSHPTTRAALLDFEQRLRVMDECGVDMHLLSLAQPGVQPFEPRAASAMARRCNDFLAEIIRRHPKRFAGLAAVAPQDIDAPAEVDRAITVLGLNGVLINSNTNDEFLDNPKFDPILAALARHGAALYLHPRVPAPSMIQAYIDYRMPGAIWGFGAEAGLHALRMILSGVFDRHPQLTVVLGHMGESIPYWLWRIDNHYKKLHAFAGPDFHRLAKLPSEYVRNNFYITTSGMNSHAVLRFCLEIMGADRIMFAIDYPFESSEESVTFLETAPISDADREKIAYRNAERVFNLKLL